VPASANLHGRRAGLPDISRAWPASAPMIELAASGAVRGHQRVHIKNFAIGRAASVKWDSVPRRHALLNKYAGNER
jgi:hypothetical protein